MDWRDKDDLELTSEDVEAMAAEGQLVAVRGPQLAGGGRFVRQAETFAGVTTLRQTKHWIQPLGGPVGPTVLSH